MGTAAHSEGRWLDPLSGGRPRNMWVGRRGRGAREWGRGGHSGWGYVPGLLTGARNIYSLDDRRPWRHGSHYAPRLLA